MVRGIENSHVLGRWSGELSGDGGDGVRLCVLEMAELTDVS